MLSLVRASPALFVNTQLLLLFFLLPNCYQSNQPLSHLARIEKIAPTEKKKCLFCLFFFSGEEKFLVNTSRHHTDGAGGSLSGGLPVKERNVILPFVTVTPERL